MKEEKIKRYIYKQTINVRNNANTQMYIFRSEKNVRFYDRILSNQKKSKKKLQ